MTAPPARSTLDSRPAARAPVAKEAAVVERLRPSPAAIWTVFLLFALSPAPAIASSARSHGHPRDVKRRSLRIDDANADTYYDVHVAFGTATTLAFQIGIRDKGVTFADVKQRFFQPQLNDKTLLVVPKADLGAKETLELTVELEDGTVLPFKLSTLPDEADGLIDVYVDLSKRAAPESVGALKEQLETVQSQLDECKAGAAGQGIEKLAALLLAQDLGRPQTFLAEHHSTHALDKQSRLLVETKVLYRLVDTSYLVLTVENRDSSRPWMLERAKLSIGNGDSSEEVKVFSAQPELVSLPPREVEKLVIAFRTPARETSHAFTLELLEKGGNRHVKLEDLGL